MGNEAPSSERFVEGRNKIGTNPTFPKVAGPAGRRQARNPSLPRWSEKAAVGTLLVYDDTLIINAYPNLPLALTVVDDVKCGMRGGGC
jgi:hypothetical protein